MPTPASRSSFITSMARRGLSMTAVSVISKRSLAADLAQRAIGELLVGDQAAGHVDGERDVAAGFAQAALVSDGAIEHPVGERADVAGLFRHADEAVGRDHAALGMAPAQQHFGGG